MVIDYIPILTIKELKELIDYTFEKLNKIKIIVQDDIDSGDTILYMKYNEE